MEEKLHNRMVLLSLILMMAGSLLQNYSVLIVMGFIYLGEEIRYLGKK